MRRARKAVGTVLVVVGVAVLAWSGWQYWGTNWQSRHRHAEVSEALRHGWRTGTGGVQTDFGVATAILHIPSFGRHWSVPVLEGSSDEVLAAGVGHLDDTAEPGQEGNVVLAGHRVTHGEPFARIRDLRPGDVVRIETRTTTYTYVLDTSGRDLDVPFTDGWVLDARPHNPHGGTGPADFPRLLTLVTCAEVFRTSQRTVVFGHLVGSAPS